MRGVVFAIHAYMRREWGQAPHVRCTHVHHRHRYGAALEHLKAAADVLHELTDSHPLDTIMLLGQAYERSGDMEKTVEAFKRGVRALALEHASCVDG
jgi:hypothetical protein